MPAPLKMRRHQQAGRLLIELRGDVAAARCNCLENFWNRHCGPDVSVVEVAMQGVQAIDEQAWRSLLRCAERARARGVEVRGLEERP